jgi:hypothetical protein
MRTQDVVIVMLLGACVSSTGCAGFHPAAIDPAEFRERAVTETREDLRVGVVVPGAEETRRIFDTKLYKKRIQPVWVEIENRTDERAFFFTYFVDPDYFPPLEVAWKSHRTWAKNTNRRIDRFYYAQAVPREVPPGGRVSGFVFVNRDRGSKYVPMAVLQEGDLHEFEFVVHVPGFRADHTSVDFEGLYDERGWTALHTEDELRDWVRALPCCTTNKKAKKTGDPLNFVLVATDRAFVHGFVRAGWDETAEMTTGSAAKTAASAIFGRSYRYAPISPLYVMDRPQDIGLQKGRWNVHQRNHLRLWLAPVTYGDRQVWIGQISRDIGSRLTTKSSTLTTHKIDPDVDEARDFLALDLLNAGAVASLGFESGVGRFTPEQPGRNLTGDPFFTDGRRVVMFLSETPVELDDVELLEWTVPPGGR